MIEVEPRDAIDVAVFASVSTHGKRLREVFRDVSAQLPVGKREVKASLQRLRKGGKIFMTYKIGKWFPVKEAP